MKTFHTCAFRDYELDDLVTYKLSVETKIFKRKRDKLSVTELRARLEAVNNELFIRRMHRLCK